MTDWAWCFEHPKDAAGLIDLLTIERDRYREALERIAQKDYHSVTNNTRGEFGWIAEQALRGGEEAHES